MPRLSSTQKPTLTVATGTSIGILFGVVMALAITILNPVLLRLSAARSLNEFWWTAIDVLRNAEDWLFSLTRYPSGTAYDLQRIALSPLGFCMVLAVLCAIHLFWFTRKRS